MLVLSSEDGHLHITNTAVSVCEAVLQNRVKVEDINVELLDKKLTGRCNNELGTIRF